MLLLLFFCMGYPQPIACESSKVLCLAVHLSTSLATAATCSVERDHLPLFHCSDMSQPLTSLPGQAGRYWGGAELRRRYSNNNQTEYGDIMRKVMGPCIEAK